MYEYIGLSGWARSGKDTVGEILEAHYGYHKMAYADVLRDFLVAQNPWVRSDDSRHTVKLSTIIDEHGWQGYKNSPFAGDLRTLIQRTGTEAGRGVISPTVWIDATLRRAAEWERVVITDVRFPNEADAIRNAKNSTALWWISRPGIEPANDHASENSLNEYEFDSNLYNDSDIETLSLQLKQFLVD